MILNILPFIAISIAIILLWSNKYRMQSLFLFIVSVLLSLCIHSINIIGIAVIIMAMILSYSENKTYKKHYKTINKTLFLATLLYLSSMYLHVFTGFSNVNIFDHILVSKDAIPFSLYLNFDSAIATYVLLLFTKNIQLAKKEGILAVIKYGAIFGIISTSILLTIILSVGFVRWDIKFTEITLVFAVVNLLTCVFEEIFWRGFIQGRIASYSNHAIAIILTSTFFALIHIIFAGVGFAILAFIAGIIYGICYAKSKLIESSIICHFMVNILQFIFLTYPILRCS